MDWTMERLEQAAANCQRCALAQTRHNVVFGKGRTDAAVPLIGEGPGANEDQQGEPFVGQAGQLLDKILAAADLPADDIYICNIVKCRPPGNRLPAREEVEACAAFWRWQVKLVNPAIIVCLGALATQQVVAKDARITKVRGMWAERDGFLIMPTFHPAALLRDPSKKRPVWQDMQQVRDVYRQIKAGRRPSLEALAAVCETEKKEQEQTEAWPPPLI